MNGRQVRREPSNKEPNRWCRSLHTNVSKITLVPDKTYIHIGLQSCMPLPYGL